MKTIESYGPPVRRITCCTVVHLKDTNEWMVKAYDQRSRRYREADYFTDDEDDALSTMIAMLDNDKDAGQRVEYDVRKRQAWLTRGGVA